MELERFIIVFTRARHWSLFWARWIQSTPSHPISSRSFLILCSNLRLGFPSWMPITHVSMLKVSWFINWTNTDCVPRYSHLCASLALHHGGKGPHMRNIYTSWKWVWSCKWSSISGNCAFKVKCLIDFKGTVTSMPKHHCKKRTRGRGTVPHIYNLDTRDKWFLSLALLFLYPQEWDTGRPAHWARGWLSIRTGISVVEKTKFAPCRESKPSRQSQPVNLLPDLSRHSEWRTAKNNFKCDIEGCWRCCIVWLVIKTKLGSLFAEAARKWGRRDKNKLNPPLFLRAHKLGNSIII
jgi:hypothetical protein